MSNYSLYLPNYTIGTDAYSKIPYVARYLGKKAVVIGGKIALSKAQDKLIATLKDTNIELTDFIWYGGDASYENVEMLLKNDNVQNADILIAVGGGRACDTVKVVADKLDKPIFTLPTLASNCAPVTSISVMYNADGTFCDYYYPKLMDHCFIDTAIIADSPAELLWAGIGDALSKEYEAVFSSKDDILSHTPFMGKQLSHVCTQPLLDFGVKALDDLKNLKPSYELEQVTLDIIISTGIVSNMMTTKDDYYYNSTLAHCVYYGATVTKGGHTHLHGEVVSLGTLCLLEFAGETEELAKLMEFNYSLNLPVCFNDVDITEDDFEIMADKFVTSTEWTHLPAGTTREGFITAMKSLNKKGEAFKATK